MFYAKLYKYSQSLTFAISSLNEQLQTLPLTFVNYVPSVTYSSTLTL